VNRANMKFTNSITTTSRVSVRNISESEREGAKTNRERIKRWSQRPGLFQPFPSLKRSLGPSELLFSIKREPNFPARTTTQLMSLASVTIELIAKRMRERSNPSARAQMNTTNLSH
jgi:hypothetical protein